VATVVDRLVVELGLDPKAFTKGQKEASAALLRTRKEAERLARNALRLFALFTAGRSIGQFVKDITGADAALGRLATSIGRTPEIISAMSKAVERSGGDANAAARSFQTWSEQVEQIRTTGDSSILPFLARLQAAGGKTIDLNKRNVDGLADLADNLKAVAEQQGIASATYYGKNLGFDEGTIALMVKGGAALRKAIEESEKLGIATRKDTEAAQALETAYRTLTQEVESFGRTILTAVSPVLVQLLKDVQAIVRAIKEWTEANVIPFLREFASSMGIAGSETQTLVRITEALFALWLGSKAIAFLRVLGTMRLLLTGGRVAAGATAVASGGLLGGIMGALGLGGAAAAATSQNMLPGPTEGRSWHEGLVRSLDPGLADRIYGPGGGGGGGPTLMGRATGWVRRKLGLGGAAAGAGGSVSALPIEPGNGEGHVASRAERASYIRQAAARNGIDPEVALRVAQSEGFNNYTGDQGRSFGDWQLFTGGGLGNKAEKEGINVRDPNTWKAQTDFAMREAARGGWGPWHGAAGAGIGNWQGIGRAAAQSVGRGSANHMHGQYGPAGSNLTTIRTASGKTVTVHSAAAESFKGFIDELEASGYKIDSLGGYNYRTKRNGTSLSQHAYGNAIDINPQKNPMTYGPLVTDMPKNISDMAAKHGLSWGGDWKNSKDAMHFEWTGRNLKDAAPQPPKAAPQAWWRGAPNAMASVSQAREAQAAQIGRQMNDNRSNSTTTNSTHIGSVTVQTAATDASGIARDMEESLKRRSFVAAATTGQA
jgi:hypothetical protein